jgi:hypothetical protein
MFGEAHTSGIEELPLVSVGLTFEAAQAQGIGIRVLTSPEDVDALPYPADAMARLRAALGNGRLAVAPEASMLFGDEERVGWWLIDPRTGSAVDEMDDGRGTEGEYTATTTPSVRATPVYRRTGGCLLAWGVIAGIQLGIGAQALGAAAGSTDLGTQVAGLVLGGLGLGGAGASGLAALSPQACK